MWDKTMNRKQYQQKNKEGIPSLTDKQKQNLHDNLTICDRINKNYFGRR